MSRRSELIDKLKSHAGDDAVEFAQLLAAEGDPAVISHILNAVERPENDHAQGPLLQSLIALDCGAHLARLAAIMDGDGYEVKFMTVNVLESVAAPVDADEKRRAVDVLRDLAAAGSDLPQDESNMIEYAATLIECLTER